MRHLATAIVCVLALAASLPATAANPVYGKDYIIVTPGMSLTRVMREFYPTRRGEWAALMDEVIATNPHAFINDAPASLKLGMRITLPGGKQPAGTVAATPAPVPATTTARATTPTRTTTQSAANASSNVQRLTVTSAGAATTAAATTTRAAVPNTRDVTTTASNSGNVKRQTQTTPRVATGTAHGATPTATASGNVARSVHTTPQVATGANTRYVVQPDPTRRQSASTSVAVAAAATTASTAASTGAAVPATGARIGTFTVTPANPVTPAASVQPEPTTIALTSHDVAATPALPEPISEERADESNLDASTQTAGVEGEKEKERPPWWWITSALLVLALML